MQFKSILAVAGLLVSAASAQNPTPAPSINIISELVAEGIPVTQLPANIQSALRNIDPGATDFDKQLSTFVNLLPSEARSEFLQGLSEGMDDATAGDNSVASATGAASANVTGGSAAATATGSTTLSPSPTQTSTATSSGPAAAKATGNSGSNVNIGKALVAVVAGVVGLVVAL